MDIDLIANKMAKELGFVSAKRTDLIFDGWTIFDPVMRPRRKNEPKPIIGLPMFILAQGDAVRWTDGDEGLGVPHLLNEKRKEKRRGSTEKIDVARVTVSRRIFLDSILSSNRTVSPYCNNRISPPSSTFTSSPAELF